MKNLTQKTRSSRIIMATTLILCLTFMISTVYATGAGNTNETTAQEFNVSASSTYKSFLSPAISGISPSEGSTAGGTVVSITGTILGRKSAIMFGSTPATNVTWISPTRLIVTAPPHAVGIVDITAITPRGSTKISSASKFTYRSPSTGTKHVVATTKETGTSSQVKTIGNRTLLATIPPVISGISATKGSVSGGIEITIHGTRLGRNSNVMFGSTPATNVTWVSPTELIVTVPPHITGDVNITVTTPRGISNITSASRFTYV